MMIGHGRGMRYTEGHLVNSVLITVNCSPTRMFYHFVEIDKKL